MEIKAIETKREARLSPFVDDMIFYEENFRNSIMNPIRINK
jgi:hypothetical protein